MYQPYPSGSAQPEPQQRPEPPPPVRNAVKLMYAGAAVTAVSLILTLVTIGSLKTAIHNANPNLSASKLHSAEVAAVAVAVIFGLIGVGLWLWMAWANNAGKNWARITATVFFGLDTVSLLASLRQAEPVVSRVITVVIWLIGLGTIVLLWQRPSSEYFQAVKGPQYR